MNNCQATMRNEVSDPELCSLLAQFDAARGVLDYVFLERQYEGLPYDCHRAAALAGMIEINRRVEQWSLQNISATSPNRMFRIRWDEARLTGKPVSLSAFWGTDDIEPKPMGDNAWSIPNVDGYKTAFFHPPYGLDGSTSENIELFTGINKHALGTAPELAEIYMWSTDWSNYFDAGLEWWGAFYWTIRPAGSQLMVVIGASSTD